MKNINKTKYQFWINGKKVVVEAISHDEAIKKIKKQEKQGSK